MPKIKQLSQQEAQKIAAGQVVERPANIVKELIENSIDAGATHISLYIQDGGKQLIRVIDNGCGMDIDDAKQCFSKHATSKITFMDELYSITTFGFRGEALASIAAVSKVTLITKTADTHEGIKLEITEDTFSNQEVVAAPTGTDISIADLFYNIPARKKFLKTRETELRHIVQLFQAFCLSYPSIHFTLYSENRLFLTCPVVQQITDRFAQLFDTSSAQHMLHVDIQDTITITGAISNHQYARYDRNGIFFFVNNRWVKDFKLANALIKGYSNVLPHGKYPMAALALTIDPHMIDVNVHPRKEEVAFEKPRVIENAIKQAVKHALEQNLSKQIGQSVQLNSSIPQYNEQSSPLPVFAQGFDGHGGTSGKEKQLYTNINNQFTNFAPNNINKSETLASQIQSSFSAHPECFENEMNKMYRGKHIKHNPYTPFNFDAEFPVPEKWNQLTTEQKTFTTSQEISKSHTILGQFNLTYILIEKEDGLFLVDQHAAHERIMYEQFAKHFENIPTINLMFPQLIQLSADEVSHLEPHIDFLKQNGIAVELFGENQIKIQSTPVHLKNASIEELIKELIGWIIEYKNLDTAEFKRAIDRKLHAQMACKAAVKAGDKLTHEQMTELLQNLEKTENNLTCPHGRPTGFLLSLYDIEKKFKRKL